VILGTPGDDTIRGLEGNDTICGGGGFDTIDGGSGDDILEGGPGDAGQNGLEYGSAAGAVTVDLARSGQPQDTGGAGTDTFSGFNELYGSPHNDQLFGSQAGDFLAGIGGVDEIDARAGDDEVWGGDGHDTVAGGLGVDRLFGQDKDTPNDGFSDVLSFAQSGAPAKVDLSLTGSQPTGEGSDTVAGFSDVTGSPFADVIQGNALNNTLKGATGGDTITGRSARDRLVGEGGNDKLDAADGIRDLEITCGGGRRDSALFDQGSDPGPRGCER